MTAWWNPFSKAQVASAKSTPSNTDAEVPRQIQERKDATLALLAITFRRLSMENPNPDRENIIDMAFTELEEKELDGKTILQLRHELQNSISNQVVELFQAFGTIDESLPPDPDEDDLMHDQILELELERTIDKLADTNPQQMAPKGQDPKQFLTLKRGALETLLGRRRQRGLEHTAISPEEESLSSPSATGDESPQQGDEESSNKRVSWVEADPLGYHETIDEERNELIRHYQTVNMCRSAKMRDAWGFSVVALQSSVPGAGRGVYVDGYAKAGSILAFQPGEVWSKEHLVNLPVEIERQLEKNDNYQMSLRPDDFMIDSRQSPYTVLSGNNCNLMALGHVVNHPTPSKAPNCRSVMIDFTQGMELGSVLKRYIPNTYARPRNLSLMGSLYDQDTVDMHGMCLIATRDICNEEIFYDYRLMTPHLPQWYHRVQDTAYETPATEDENETKS